MKTIGITGGVGAGKSQVLKFLEEAYQAEVIQADLIAKELMKPGQKGYEKLIEIFGSEILAENHFIDSALLRERMFRDPRMIQTVNNIIHPMVWQEIKNRRKQSKADLLVVETAIPAENPSDIYEELWYVYTSEENRIHRLMTGRGYTREQSRAMMDNQMSEEQFRTLADQVIDNNGSEQETRRQIEAILKSEGW